MYDMTRQFERTFQKLEEDLSPDQRQRAEIVIRQLTDLLDTKKEFGQIPGGVDSFNFYINKIDNNIHNMRSHMRDPPPDLVELERQRKILQANYLKLFDDFPKVLIASLSKGNVMVVDASGAINHISGQDIVNKPDGVKEVLDDIRNSDMTRLKEEIEWMRDVGFMPPKSYGLARWKFKFPSVDATLFGGNVNTNDTANYTLKMKRQLAEVTGKANMILGEWTHVQIEELIDTLSSVLYAINELSQFSLRHFDNSGGSHIREQQRLLDLSMQIDNIGDRYILYRIKTKVKMTPNGADAPEQIIDIPSNRIKSAKQVAKYLTDGIKAMLPSREMKPVGGSVA